MGRKVTAALAAPLIILGMAVAGSTCAAASLLDGDLGRWLDDTATALGDTLSRHPRFSGETVRLVTLTPDAVKPGQSNRLAQAVEQRMRQRLLEIDGVRLAVDQPERACAPPQTIDYLVRIELTPQGARSARIHVAVVDVAESLWVSGISHQWHGRLSTAARTALEDPVSAAIAGSASSPIPLEDVHEVARAMKADLTCLLPAGLDGALYVTTPEAPALARVGLALKSELVFEPLAALTAQRDEARWLLEIDARNATADVHELSLTLAEVTSAANGGNRQRVGSVFVSGAAAGAAASATGAVASAGAGAVAGAAATRPAAAPTGSSTPAPTIARPDARTGALLAPLELHGVPPKGVCDNRKARVNSCAEIEVDLREPAYLFVLSTQDHTVIDAPCETSPQRRAAGSLRFRLRVPPGTYALNVSDTGPDAGFYVLATRSRSAALRLLAQLGSAPGVCGRARGSTKRWLADLQSVLDREGDEVVWRAIHLAHDSGGIVAL